MPQVVAPQGLFGAPVNAPGTANQSYNTIFDANSTNVVSHKIDVNQNAVVVKAFGLTGEESIDVQMYADTKLGPVSTVMMLNGKSITLTPDTNTIVLDMPGSYNFRLHGSLGTVTCIFIETGSSYWSYGLAAFAAASS